MIIMKKKMKNLCNVEVKSGKDNGETPQIVPISLLTESGCSVGSVMDNHSISETHTQKGGVR